MPEAVKAGHFGYYESHGKKVPIQREGLPFSDVTCSACGVPAPFPLEYDGDLVCGHLCGRAKHPDHPALPHDEKYWKSLELKEKARKAIEDARKLAAEAGVAL